MLAQFRGLNQNFPKAQLLSIGIHATFIGLLLVPFAARMNLRFPPPATWITDRGPLRPPSSTFLRGLAGKDGSGGQKELTPAGRGSMRFSAIPIAPIRRVTNPDAALKVLPSVLGPPDLEYRVDAHRWGVPWSNLNSDSLGRGCCEGAGNSKGITVGDHNGDGFNQYPGNGTPGYATPTCSYCPNPSFTDEAIRVKFQGTVVLRVLVSAEGRAERIQVLQGVGMGLEQRATETVRRWRFHPGRALNGQATPMVVLIEVQFRQF